MVTCRDDGQVWLFDMATGEQINSWDFGEGATVRGFGHPDGP